MPARVGRAFAIGLLLNLAFVVLGVVAGIAANSTALLADAAHNLGDALGLGMAWAAMQLAKRARSARRTYGFRRTTIIAALTNAMLILVAIGGVAWEAVSRLRETHPVEGGIVAAVAAVGVAINAAAAALFAADRHGDVNLRGAFLHLIADAAVSAGVVIAGLIVWQTGWAWVDPATSLAVSAVILIGTLRLFREAMDLLLDAVPAHIDPGAVEAYLRGLPGVCDVHDLHIWPMSTTEVALTAHVVVGWSAEPPAFLGELDDALVERFQISHATVQLEPADPRSPCARAAGDRV